ncbi:hypothetical protein PQX77_021017 [Marasmius sp. AFHP31]|nr:hypothetical protein PQX77_021017 [Marasmius sp. AFHP31]
MSPSSPNWWDRDWSSDSLFLSDNEEDFVSGMSQYSGSESGTPYEGTPHSEHEPGEPDVDPQLGYPYDLSYDLDGDSNYDLGHGSNNENNVTLEVGHVEYNGKTSQQPEDIMLFFDSEDALDPGYDKHEDPTLVNLKELGSEYDLDNGSGPPMEEEDEPDYTSDGASQRSEDWGIPPDKQSNHGYDSPCENDEYYVDEIDQYEHGGDENPDKYLALVSQNFPRLLWFLQLPKHIYLLPSPKQVISYKL